MPALVGRDLVCVSVMDWEHPFASSRHHLMREFARHNRVLFVDNQFNPLSVLARWQQAPMRRKLLHWAHLAPNPRPLGTHLWGYTPPPVLPMGRLTNRALFERAYALNQRALRAGVKRAVRTLGLRDPILWISFNVLSSECLLDALDPALVVYHCTDEITAMETISPFAGEIERRLLARADLTFASSRRLETDKRPYTRSCHYVPNGADTALFETALTPNTAPHPALADLTGPLVGFAGHVEARFDFELLEALAERHPEWRFVIAGPVGQAQRARADALAKRPNVRFVGLLERGELPGFLKALDVAIIPFVHSAQTRAIYPLKLNEYLAAGKPVVLTPFADLREFEGLVGVADGAAAFGEALEAALAPAQRAPEAIAARVALARANQWSARATEMERYLLEALAAKARGDRTESA